MLLLSASMTTALCNSLLLLFIHHRYRALFIFHLSSLSLSPLPLPLPQRLPERGFARRATSIEASFRPSFSSTARRASAMASIAAWSRNYYVSAVEDYFASFNHVVLTFLFPILSILLRPNSQHGHHDGHVRGDGPRADEPARAHTNGAANLVDLFPLPLSLNSATSFPLLY